MKLSRLYTNQEERFSPVEFGTGLNAVVAEIRLPENLDRDTHNLGKTTLARLLDFCLLSKRDSKFFLFKHEALFEDFVFFLEIELANGSYVTVRRSVKDPTKISFKRHSSRTSELAECLEWDHENVPFDRARQLLDATLDWREIKPWSYRHILGYLLRTQDDYREVFQLRKFASKHADWKPFLARLLGFDAALIELCYAKEEALAKKVAAAQVIKNELGGDDVDLSKVEGILLLKRNDADRKQGLLDQFDFQVDDKEKTKQLVDSVEHQISALNSQRYSLQRARKRVVSSLSEEKILFDPQQAEQLFLDAGVLFEGQIKRDLKQLIAFNVAITEERREYLTGDLQGIDLEIAEVNKELTVLNRKRGEILSFLEDTDTFTKFRRLTDEMVSVRADISSLERQSSFLNRLHEVRAEIRTLEEEIAHLKAQVESNVDETNRSTGSLFSAIRLAFSEVVEEVISQKALLRVFTNTAGHMEFRVEILDESGNTTSASAGHTYRKLLCIAFDLAILRAHQGPHFPSFVYHDGVFESLDDRKKENLLRVFRRFADAGLQPIITLIDSEIPNAPAAVDFIQSDEVVLTLHDEGKEGLLFKMPAW